MVDNAFYTVSQGATQVPAGMPPKVGKPMSIHIQVPPTSCHNFISLYVSLCKPQRCLSSGLSVSTVVLLSAISNRWFYYRFEVHGISETFPERALPHFRNLVAALSCIISASSTRLFCASSGTGLPTSLELPRQLIVLGQSQGNGAVWAVVKDKPLSKIPAPQSHPIRNRT